MHKLDYLPIVLVSAKDSICASKIVSDLIDDKPNSEEPDISDKWRIWRIKNKYYRADVKLQPLVDGQPPPLHITELVEAHLIYLHAGESEKCAERRIVEAGQLSHKSHVRLVVSEGPESSALAAWASRRHYELVMLCEDGQELGDDEESDENEAQGVDRIRAALHAHTWRGLVRLDRPDAPLSMPNNALSDVDAESSDSWGSWEAWRGEAGSEVGDQTGSGEEAFASLMSSLAAERDALLPLPDVERRRRAELLLAAFRAALAPDDTP